MDKQNEKAMVDLLNQEIKELQDGQKDLEEMVEIIQNAVGGCARHWAELIAVNLRKNGYRKISEGAVVLTREEYEELQIGKDFNYGYHNGESNMTAYYENIRLPEVRKETAEKFAERLKGYLKQCFKDLYRTDYKEGMVALNLNTVFENIDEICKEITEGKV